MGKKSITQITAPGFFKLGACLIYEALTLIALGVVVSALFLWIAGNATHEPKRSLLQFFLWVGVGAYYIRCWTTTGQTLAMQAWRLKLVDQSNVVLNFRMALLRYVLSTISLLLMGLGFVWALLDKDRLFLHDRLLENTISDMKKPSNV